MLSSLNTCNKVRIQLRFFIVLIISVLAVTSGCKMNVTTDEAVQQNAPPPSVAVATITISRAGTGDMIVGNTEQLTIAVEPASAANKSVNWTSTDEEVATISISNGTITLNALKAGTSTITATATDESGVKKDLVITVVEPAVLITAITLGDEPLYRTAGKTERQIAFTIVPANASSKQLTWSSSDTNAATVNAEGLVSVIEATTATKVTITATAKDGSNVFGSKEYNIDDFQIGTLVTSISISAVSVTIGGSATAAATVQPADASDKGLTWASANEAIATVDGNGVVSGISQGTTTITATSKDGSAIVSNAATVTVSPVLVDSVSVSVTAGNVSNLVIGSTATLSVSVLPSNASNKAITWTSSNNTVATVTQTVSGAVVTAQTVGTTTITASAADGSGKTAETTITVVPVLVGSITISGSPTMQGIESSSINLSATVLPSNATVKTLTWSSNNPSVATVNQSGTVTSETTVTADTDVTITATATDGSGISAIHQITVQYVDVTKSVTITKSEGWLESAYLEWSPLSGAGSYNVYYQKSGTTTWTKIDTQLIRSYGTYFRADVLGLAAANYTLKVVACADDGTEFTGSSSAGVSVLPHDRTGFAFVGSTTPGAYSADGTLKANANVIYLTENTKNTVSLTVAGATTNPCVGIQTILDGYKKGSETKPLAIRMIGNVTDPSYMLSGDLVIENKNGNAGITFEGVGNDATANGWGIRIKTANYIEIRNIGTMNVDSSEGDNIGLQQANNYVWVHNNDFFYGHAGSAGDQAKGDGALDTKKSNFVTMSYNRFWDTGKSNLVGLSEAIKSFETGALYITFHHNWYDHSDSRHPRVRFYNAHVYNNYFDGISKYAAGSTLGSSVFMQNNYFRDANRPMMISMQGTDVYSKGSTRDTTNNPTFSKEDGGIIKAHGNVMVGNNTFIPYGATDILTDGTWGPATARNITTTADFDAYVVANASDTVPNTILSYQGANRYSNFDTGGTAQAMYSWTPDSAEDAKTKVMQYAGRVDGGDFKWTFNNATDDTSYALNTALKAALTGYTTTLVSIQGDGIASGGDTGGGDTGGGDTGGGTTLPAGTVSVTFDTFTSGATVNGVTITGALKSGIAAKTYNGSTYTTALKMETATLLSFTTTTAVKLTLITDLASKKIKVDDSSTTVTDADGVLKEYSLGIGAHTIKKGDTMNLYAVIITPVE